MPTVCDKDMLRMSLSYCLKDLTSRRQEISRQAYRNIGGLAYRQETCIQERI